MKKKFKIGRIGRAEYMAWNVTTGIIAVIAFAVIITASISVGSLAPLLYVIFALLFLGLMILQGIALAARLHDIRLPGWLSPIAIVALLLFKPVGLLLLLVLLLQGTAGENKFGPEPAMQGLHINRLRTLFADPDLAQHGNDIPALAK
jgi:uncharacterized membrane protein YhaH (DUF805 family)